MIYEAYLDISRRRAAVDRIPASELHEHIERIRAEPAAQNAKRIALTIADSRHPGYVGISGFVWEKNIAIMVEGSLNCDSGIQIDGGNIVTSGSLQAKSIRADSVTVNGDLRAESIIAKECVRVANRIVMPMDSVLIVSGKGGSLWAGHLDIGNLICEELEVDDRAAIRGGVLYARHVAVRGTLHIGRGRDGDLRGGVVQTLQAGLIDSEASIIVEEKAEFAAGGLIMGDLVADSLVCRGAQNFIVSGSLAVKSVESKGTIYSAIDPRHEVVGIPRTLLGEHSGRFVTGSAQHTEAFDEATARHIMSRTKFPVMDYVALAQGPLSDVDLRSEPAPVHYQADAHAPSHENLNFS